MSKEEEKDFKLMSLDEVIKANKKEGKGGRLRNFQNRRRRKSYFNRLYRSDNPKKDNRRRIQVENLGKDIQNPELQKLFKPYGTLTRCGIKFDKLGQSKGIADVEFSTHEECEKAINKLDNAEINGVRIRVKYAPSQTNRYGRRNRSAGVQRRNLRRMNRNNRRGLRTRRMGRRGIRSRRIGRRLTGDRGNGRKNIRRKRRAFARTLGRRRQEKKQN